MGGEHRRDQGAVEEFDQLRGGEPALVEGLVERVRQAAFARRRAGDQVGARAADVVLVLGDVGEVREVAEGAHDLDGLVARQRVEHVLERAAGDDVVVAPEAHRVLADVLDQLEGGLALLVAHGVAEQAAEQADILAQGCVLVLFHLIFSCAASIALSTYWA